MNLRSNKKLITNWSSSALTDIVFLLLIFFLLTSSFVAQPGIKVNLPAAETGNIERQPVVVSIGKDKTLYINQQRVNEQVYPAALRAQLDTSDDKLVVFRADKDVDLGYFVHVMDMSRTAGAEALGISTRPKE